MVPVQTKLIFLQKDNTTEVRVCQCLAGQEISPEGRCVEEKDLGILDLRKLFRKPFWSELNPGRRIMEKTDDLVRALHKCSHIDIL